MNKEEKDEIREIVSSCSTNLTTTIEAQYLVINTKLDGINGHLKNINGSVQKHEGQINEALTERAANRQKQETYFKSLDGVRPRLRKVEDHQLSTKSIKKWIAASVALTGAVLGVIYTLVQILQNV